MAKAKTLLALAFLILSTTLGSLPSGELVNGDAQQALLTIEPTGALQLIDREILIWSDFVHIYGGSQLIILDLESFLEALNLSKDEQLNLETLSHWLYRLLFNRSISLSATIFQTPNTSFRDMQSLDILPEPSDPGAPVSFFNYLSILEEIASL